MSSENSLSASLVILALLLAVAPALASAFLMTFALSLDDLVIASFTTGPGATTLPMRIYSQVRLGVTPQVNAISSLLLGFVGVILVLTALILRRRQSADERAE